MINDVEISSYTQFMKNQNISNSMKKMCIGEEECMFGFVCIYTIFFNQFISDQKSTAAKRKEQKPIHKVTNTVRQFKDNQNEEAQFVS